MQQIGSTLDIGFPYGVGESLVLAKKLGVPLYSDESTLRIWARNDYGVAAFGTIAVARALVAKGLWTPDKETDIFARLIGMNYRWVPFGITHLNCRLRAIVSACQGLGRRMTSAALLQDEQLGLLMRWFGEPKLKGDNRVTFAIQWWRSIIGADPVWREVLAACMVYATDCYVSASASSVLQAKIVRHEREEKAAHLLSAFLWVAYKDHREDFQLTWLAVKECVEELFPQSEDIPKLILLKLMPKWLHFWANQDDSVDANQRTNFLVDISSRLPYEDKEPFETALTKLFAKKGP